jgi:hypothetical protein
LPRGARRIMLAKFLEHPGQSGMRATIRKTLPLLTILMSCSASVVFAQGLSGLVKPAISDVSLENLSVKGKEGGTVTIRKVDVTATNLTKDEVAKLFNPDTPKDVASALAAKMKADKIAIPDISVNDKDATLAFHDVSIMGVNEGKVGSFVLSSFDGKVTNKDAGQVTLKSGPLQIKNMNLARMMSGVKTGNFVDSTMQVGSVSWTGFEASFPDKDTPATAPGGNLIKVSLASLSGDNTYDGEIPVKSAGKGDHLVVELPKESSGAKQIAQFGVDKIDLGFTVAASYDKAKKSFNLEDYTISGVKLGSFGFKGVVGGIDPAMFTSDAKTRIAALMGSDVANIAISYKDGGLFNNVLAFVAGQQGKTGDALRTEWSAMATQLLPLLLGGDPSSLKLAEAVGSFIATPKSLTISAKAKGAPVKVTDLMNLSDPKAILSKIDLSAVSGQ